MLDMTKQRYTNMSTDKKRNEIFNFMRRMERSKNYLKMDDLKDGYSYKIFARNAYVGIWLSQEKSFLIARYKFEPDPFIFKEHHWDSDPTGTVKPLEEIEKCPFVIPYDDIHEKIILSYLEKLEEQHPIMSGFNSLQDRKEPAVRFWLRNLRLEDAPQRGAWIQTYTGLKFYPLGARPEEVHVEDIAHALSMLCRFNGHLEKFYSVAEHSVYVSHIVSKENQLWALLHDAAEAYLSDIPSPVKANLPQFKNIEDILLEVVCERFNLPFGIPSEVKEADLIMLSTEKKVLMKEEPEHWGNLPEPSNSIDIKGLPPEQAEELFLRRYNEICS